MSPFQDWDGEESAEMIFGEHLQNRIRVRPRRSCANFLREEEEEHYGPLHQMTFNQTFVPIAVIKIEIDLMIEEWE